MLDFELLWEVLESWKNLPYETYQQSEGYKTYAAWYDLMSDEQWMEWVTYMQRREADGL